MVPPGGRARQSRPSACPYVGKGGLKLAFALDRFGISVSGMVCADMGSHVGGFVDCLLQRGASRVYSVDTARGVLDWKLRKDPRVVVFERSNAMHVTLPERVSLVTIDVGWTPQRLILPAAEKWLVDGGRIISLVKLQYELGERSLRRGGVLDGAQAEEAIAIAERGIPSSLVLLDSAESPLRGSGGNVEIFWLLGKR